MSLNKPSLFFSRKIKNNEPNFQSYQPNDKGLDYFFELTKKTASHQKEVAHGLVELEGYIDHLNFQQAEIKAKLQLGEACKKLLEKALNEKVFRQENSSKRDFMNRIEM